MARLCPSAELVCWWGIPAGPGLAQRRSWVTITGWLLALASTGSLVGD